MICNSVVQVTLNTDDSRHYYFKNKYLQDILVLVIECLLPSLTASTANKN
jgi:hypothetical protein